MRVEPEHAAARGVLLDAIEALGSQATSVVLVGAQAVYLRCGDGGLAVAPMTTDADLALNADLITDEPELCTAMEAAGFVPGSQPGTWLGHSGIGVDLMIVPHQSGRTGKSARAANIPPHRRGIARVTRGLEAALVDNGPMQVAALSATDQRGFSIKVAGPAALLVAKLIKLDDRLRASVDGQRSRLVAKDALDVLRLLQAARVDDLTDALERHRSAEHAAPVSAEAMAVLRKHGLRHGAPLPRLASQAVGEEPIIEASFVALAGQLLSAVGS